MKRVTNRQTLYSGKGDGGRTSLLGKHNVSKGSHRIELLGELDELSAALGLARAFSDQAATKAVLLELQRDIYVVMAELAATGKKAGEIKPLDGERVAWLESHIDRLSARTKPPKGFILPGDNQAGAALDVARAVSRRVERRVVREMDRGRKVSSIILSYLNRISSLLYALELHELDAQAVKPTAAKKDAA